MSGVGYLIIGLELIGTAVFGLHDYTVAKAIQDCAFLIVGASLIIVDRVKPHVKNSKVIPSTSSTINEKHDENNKA